MANVNGKCGKTCLQDPSKMLVWKSKRGLICGGTPYALDHKISLTVPVALLSLLRYATTATYHTF
jgi:hypothetical protein